MKKRFLALGLAILISGAAVLGVGLYLKYRVLNPLGLAQDENAAAIPFLLAADPGLRHAVELAGEVTEPATEPPATTAPPVTEPPETIPPTTEPPETVPPTTEPPETVPPTTEPPDPVPAEPVEESWYDDVLFIGDSRTVGLRDYARKGNADYFCSVGMTVFDCRTQKNDDRGFAKQTLGSLLSSKTYGKIFIGLGINECGYPFESLMKAYRDLVDYLREVQPDAVIILEGIMTVSQKKANSASYFRISNLFYINENIAAMADNETIFYIDVNEIFADEEGYLPAEISGDGCHPYAKYYKEWSDWISYAVAQLGI